MAKANLEWEKTNAQAAKASKANKAPVDNLVAKPTAIVEEGNVTGAMQEAQRVTQKLVIFSVIQQEATDYAVDGMCGEVTWGTCERSRRYGP